MPKVVGNGYHSLRRLLVTGVLLASSSFVTVGAVTGTAGADMRPAAVNPPVISIAGTVDDPTGFGLNGLRPNRNHTSLYVTTFGPLVEVSLGTLIATPIDGFTAAAGGALTYDPSGEWILVPTSNGSGTVYLEFLDPDTGLVDDSKRIDLSDGTNLYAAGAIVAGLVDGVPYAFVMTVAYSFTGAQPHLVSVNLTSGAVSRVSIGDLGLWNNKGYPVALSADGTELYLATETVIKRYATPALTPVAGDVAAVATQLRVFDDDTASGTNKGLLYAAGGTTLTVIDLDASDAVLHSVTLSSEVKSMDVRSNGDIALGGFDPMMDYFHLATETLISTDYSASLRYGPNAFALGIAIDESPLYGVCIYTANNNDSSVTAFSVDGADCGPFAGRFGPLADTLEIGGSFEFTFDAPTSSSRAAEWVGIGVYVDCALVDVIEPPFSGSYTVNHADLPTGVSLAFRAYTQADLDAAEFDSVEDTDCTTAAAESAATMLEYVPLPAAQIDAGGSHTCALLEGSVYCWGANWDGQLGDGSDGNSASAVKVVNGVDGFTNADVTAISMGGSHSCALRQGSVYCWGANGDGQLGDGSTVASSVPVKVADGEDGFTNSGVTAISVGGAHTCAVVGGSVYCWGSNQHGRLGDDALTNRSTAVKVADVVGGFTNSGVTAISAGTAHTCAVVGGSVYCWGNNNRGRLGDGTTTNRLTAVKVLNGADGFTNSDVTAIGAGGRHSCALVDGSVYCWGRNEEGQLGDGSEDNSASPVKVADVADGFTNAAVIAISVGEQHSCAMVGGSLYCWGDNEEKQLGAGISDEVVTEAVAVLSVDGGFTNAAVTGFSPGDEHTCAIDAGRVYCWGNNGDNQLGNGTTRRSGVASPVCCDPGSGGGGSGGGSGGGGSGGGSDNGDGSDDGGGSVGGGAPGAGSTTNPTLPGPVGPSPVPINGVLPDLLIGEVVVIEGGQPVVVEVFVESESTLVLRSAGADGFELRLTGVCEGRGCRIETLADGRQVLRLQVGGSAFTEGTGFLPGSQVDIWLFSEPRYLGELTVRADGTFAGTVEIGGVAPGEHTLQVNGLGRSGVQRSVNLGVVVDQSDGATLPRSGGSPGAVLILAAALFALGVLTLTRRRCPAGRVF
jgi:alpha-tubulin suppressor-like RCC1 family protein